MVHVPNLLRRQHDEDVHAHFSNDTGINHRSSPSNLNAMDEVPSPPSTHEELEEEEEEEQGRRRERGDQDDDVPSSSSADWLRLGLGGASSSRQAPKELQLFVDRPSSSPSSSSAAVPPWRSSSTPAAPAQPTSLLGTREAAEGRGGIRVVSPPRRQTGIWLMLQAAAALQTDQGRQPSLPEIPTNYLRIKDGSVTVRLLMRHAANKLGLENELEVELTCRDQVLLPSMTLQHVRDNIWYSGDPPPVFPDSPSTHQVMKLQYKRSTSASGSH